VLVQGLGFVGPVAPGVTQGNRPLAAPADGVIRITAHEMGI
jgi:hypothetical protein